MSKRLHPPPGIGLALVIDLDMYVRAIFKILLNVGLNAIRGR